MASIKISFVLVIFCLLIATAVSIRKRNFKLTSRIVNGFDANRNQFPYFASLSFKNSTLRKQNFCGGAVISHWHILTAAHCFSAYKPQSNTLSAVFGKHGFSDNGVIVTKIEKVIVHPVFGTYNKNDIALLKTVNEIEFSALVQPIALPRTNVDSEGGQSALSCGFGALNLAQPQDRIYPEVLQYHETKTLSLNDCKTKIEGFREILDGETWEMTKTILKNEQIFCALNEFNRTGPCNGDSGGPLVFNNTLIGVVSAAIGCALGFPVTYTNVYEYRDWIRTEMIKSILE